jgi:hypothetical protein
MYAEENKLTKSLSFTIKSRSKTIGNYLGEYLLLIYLSKILILPVHLLIIVLLIVAIHFLSLGFVGVFELVLGGVV